jgi:hypothetical protein
MTQYRIFLNNIEPNIYRYAMGKTLITKNILNFNKFVWINVLSNFLFTVFIRFLSEYPIYPNEKVIKTHN